MPRATVPRGRRERRGLGKGRKVTTCLFCGKTSRDVGPMVEGPSDVYICANCTDLCQNIFRQERRRFFVRPRPVHRRFPPSREIKEFPDQYVIGGTSQVLCRSRFTITTSAC